jgi:hypothetical protein
MPTATDLVTDLPADFEVFGQAVDTRLKALQPGTTLGDLAYSSATANTNTRLPIGTSGQVLAVSGGGVPEWTTTADVTPLTTKGDLFTFTTSDARIGVGANGTVLTADSAEATGLKWATPVTGGAFTLLETGTLTGASVTTGSLSQAYTDLYIQVIDYKPATDAARLRIRPNGVSAANSYTQGNASGYTTLAFDETYIGISLDADNSVVSNLCTINIPAYANTTTFKIVTCNAAVVNAATTTSVSMSNFITGVTKAVSAISTIQFLPSAGNFTSGTYNVYGVK